MHQSQRVIITGDNDQGKSVVIEDKQVPIQGIGTFEFWQTRGGRSGFDPNNASDGFDFFPQAGQSLFRLFTIPAGDPTLTGEQVAAMADGFFQHIGWEGARRDTSRHPFMHVTPTLDYIVLLSGEISLALDEGEFIPLKQFDAVVQRQTNHGWVNTGTTDALLLCVMVGQPAE